MRIYFDPRDWWIGYYRGPHHHYVCPLPTLVIRWRRPVRLDADGFCRHGLAAGVGCHVCDA